MEGNKAPQSTSLQGMTKPSILTISTVMRYLLLPAVIRAVAMNDEDFNVKGEYLNFAPVGCTSRRTRRALAPGREGKADATAQLIRSR